MNYHLAGYCSIEFKRDYFIICPIREIASASITLNIIRHSHLALHSTILGLAGSGFSVTKEYLHMSSWDSLRRITSTGVSIPVEQGSDYLYDCTEGNERQSAPPVPCTGRENPPFRG